MSNHQHQSRASVGVAPRRNLYHRILNLIGWTVLPTSVRPPKSVICVAPHTSNWDFILGLLYYGAINGEPHFVMKKEWFFPPLGFLLRRLGGVPVDRSSGRGLVDEVVRLFEAHDTFRIAVTPEGTRSRTSKWKTGFYRMAQQVGVPIELARIDYDKREVGIFDVFYPTGDMEADIRAIRYRFAASMARYPAQYDDLSGVRTEAAEGERTEVLRVGVVQMQTAQGDVTTNISTLRRITESAGLSTLGVGMKPDLLVLPEMWTTGFVTDVESRSAADIRSDYDRGRTEMCRIAAEYDCAVYGSLISAIKVWEEGEERTRYVNEGLFVYPSGRVITYRKKHLFGRGGERKFFAAGHRRVQVGWRGWILRLTICYDLRFPVWQRQYRDAEDQYDVLINCANWPTVRLTPWRQLLQARAVENRAYVVASNRAGTGSNGLEYPGYSMVLGPDAAPIVEGDDGAEGVLMATLSRADLTQSRREMPVLEEIDPYEIEQSEL